MPKHRIVYNGKTQGPPLVYTEVYLVTALKIFKCDFSVNFPLTRVISLETTRLLKSFQDVPRSLCDWPSDTVINTSRVALILNIVVILEIIFLNRDFRIQRRNFPSLKLLCHSKMFQPLSYR